MSKKQQQLYKKAKEAKARAKAMAGKQIKSKEGRAKALKDQQAHKCTVCMQTFMCTAKVFHLQQHCSNKHPKCEAVACFPELPAMLAAEAKRAKKLAAEEEASKKKKAAAEKLGQKGVAKNKSKKKKSKKAEAALFAKLDAHLGTTKTKKKKSTKKGKK